MISAPTEHRKKVMAMAEYITKDEALAIIVTKQKEICPMGLYSRHAVYGSNREAFDNWQEILDGIEAIQSADVSPVRHGRWISLTECANEGVYCSICNKKVWKSDYAWCSKKSRNKLRSNFCPNCGAKMDGGDDND